MSKRKVRRRQGGPAIQSIGVGMRLLRSLSAAPAPMMLRDLSAAAGMPPAKAHRYLASFMLGGLIEQHGASGRYDLGPFALELGLAAMARLDPLALATPVLASLRDAIGQTVALAVWANRGPTIVRWLGADAPVTASLRVGSVMPLTRSATGGAFVAFLPERSTARLVRLELTRNRRRHLPRPSAQEFTRWIAQARRQGVVRTGRFIAGISGVAAPVYGHSGSMEMALVALGYSGNFNLALRGSLVRQVLASAQQLSARLGYRPPR